VRADIELWQDLVVPSGLIVLHDYRPEASECRRAIYEGIADSPAYECLLLVDSLLIARKKAG